ncbi:MAG: hemolysin family protein [Pseudomonadota bacterium]
MSSLQSPEVTQAQADDPSPRPAEPSANPLSSEGDETRGHDQGFSLIIWLKGLFGKSGQDIRQSLDDMVSADPVNSSTEDLSEDERTMIRNILQYHELRVDDVMVPRADIIAFDECEGFEALVAMFMDAAHSRIPVYTKTLDQVLGMVHIKDIVRPLTPKANGAARKTPSVTSLLRSVLYVPPSMRVIDLLARMRAARVHMAIVVDEYGGSDGLVTIEDLVEQIVGNIEDEHDFAEPDAVTDLGGGIWLADARLPIDQLEEIVGLKVRSDDAELDVDTLGGLVVSLAGAVPAIGEHVEHAAGLTLEVIDGDPRRIKQVRISKQPQPQQ